MKKTVLIVIRVVCIVGFLVCVGVLGWYWHNDRSDRAVAEALAAAHDAASAEAMEQVRAVAADNADTIGWLRIDGTNINNVVMFAPDTPGKYLHMDFYGKWSYRGTLYVAENCDVRTADNILIYGHHRMRHFALRTRSCSLTRSTPPIRMRSWPRSKRKSPLRALTPFDIMTASARTRSSLRSIAHSLKKTAATTPASRSGPVIGCSRCPPAPTTRRTAAFSSWRGKSTEGKPNTKNPAIRWMAGF